MKGPKQLKKNVGNSGKGMKSYKNEIKGSKQKKRRKLSERFDIQLKAYKTKIKGWKQL